MNAAQLRDFMRSWATGVAVVTALLDGKPVGCTVNAFTSVSLDPPLVLVSLTETSQTLTAIRDNHTFGVNILAENQHHLATHFATTPPAHRFAAVPHELTTGIPTLTDALATLTCSVADTIRVADHVLVFGRPRRHTSPAATTPAILYAGGYRALA
ncbi:flavin reductase (DIM6/NTAB) family NADH-FMN oxidoreductase RutF [Actinophytocola oryzae]|uniref:Flavin reductase (DIM6/NTAB) family NADH-FMN oxidoreductase RutF n=1 Tax=Actinophytocola oryzae TaxID=502181 RepID=A0A4V3FUR6_9PSEU|nr:flavin reductase (DIM6/NTAB) family NADH-FMN oxidoreductase RutF [Actinophytocola oryzae]